MTDENRDDGEAEGRYATTEEISSPNRYDLDRDEPQIVVATGPSAERHVPLEESTTSVGRAHGVDLQIEDGGVSSRHLQFVERSSSIWVEDLDSSNGTYANGERIAEPRELLDGDTIAIGRETLVCPAGGREAGEARGESVVRVGREARWFQAGDAEPVDLRRRGAIRRILHGLVEAAHRDGEERLDLHELFELGWPGQGDIDPDAAAQCVYVAIRTLRRKGSSGVLVPGDDGYYLASEDAPIEREPDTSAPPE